MANTLLLRLSRRVVAAFMLGQSYQLGRSRSNGDALKMSSTIWCVLGTSHCPSRVPGMREECLFAFPLYSVYELP
jgi:hypothetical protein